MTDSLLSTVILFSLAAAGTIAFGIHLTKLADEIAERTGIGRVLIGALLLGALTSVAEIGTSIAAALQQHAELAINNAVGSIAAQTAFLAVADLSYRHANLEHAAASVSNMMLTGLLLLLLGLLILAAVTPGLVLAGAHPISLILPLVYLYGMRLVAKSGASPMWHARRTHETHTETAMPAENTAPLARLLSRFVLVAVLLIVCGVLLAETGIALTRLTGLSESFVGALLTGVVSSAPELVTALTAVRIGALSLAVSNIVGGNIFDSVIVSMADFAYPGSIYSAAGASLAPLLAATLLMNTVLLLGLIRRERHGIGNIGLEGTLLLLMYLGVIIGLTGP